MFLVLGIVLFLEEYTLMVSNVVLKKVSESVSFRFLHLITYCFQLRCRALLIVVEKQHQLIPLPLPAGGVIEHQLEAALTSQDCWDERGANWVGDARQVGHRALGDLQVGLVSAKGNEGGTPGGGEVRRVDHLGRWFT